MDHIQKTIDDALAVLREQEGAVSDTRKLINGLCKLAGRQAMFAEAEPVSVVGPSGFRSDQFYGQPLSTVIRQILEARKAAGSGPTTVNQIYDVMVAGGYKFETANEDNAKRGLRTSLTKNSAIFHKLPNGDYGLREWYPNIKDGKAKATTNGGTETPPTAQPASKPDETGFDFDEKEREANASA